MALLDKLWSTTGIKKETRFALAVSAVLALFAWHSVRDGRGNHGVRERLVGTWKLVGVMDRAVERHVSSLPAADPELCMTLSADGSVAFGPNADHKALWFVVDRRHFHIVHSFPPDPRVPGMTAGASEDDEYEIMSLSSNRLVVRQFDYEADGVYERVNAAAETVVERPLLSPEKDSS